MTNYNNLLGLLSGTEGERKQTAWASATPTADPDVRIDCDGNLIKWSEYGKYTEFGWHIDHAMPLALGGVNGLANLRARHWRGNCGAGGLLGSFLTGK